MVAPAAIVLCKPMTNPVMWNIGTATKLMLSGVKCFHRFIACALYITVRCGCMQPLGTPVVPLVYGSMAKSSGPFSMGSGVAVQAIAAFQS